MPRTVHAPRVWQGGRRSGDPVDQTRPEIRDRPDPGHPVPDGDEHPPKEITRNISCGVAFSVADHVANDGLLGTGKYKAGIRATELRMGVDRGTSVTVGITDNVFELIRTFYVQFEDEVDAVTPVIARAMEGVKELRRTGQPRQIEAPTVDHLRDVWESLESPREELRYVLPRLHERNPGVYKKWNQARLIAELEGYEVPVGTVKGYRVVVSADVADALERLGEDQGGDDDDDLD
jgi:S-DNA-T family DNA segregation ATPase FtsK/SpoIIIE